MQNDQEIEALLNGIWDRKFNTDNLPEDLYLRTAEYLEKGLYKGYGKELDATMYYSPDNDLLSELRTNVYIFSGAKTYQQVRDMGGLIASTKSFSEFQSKAREVYDQYNKHWLKAEYQTAQGQGQMAVLWGQIEHTKDIFPYLEYKAVIDSKTSEICKPLDGVILKVDDPFWDKYSPLNHFNCRCTIKKLDKYTDKLTTNPERMSEIMKELDVPKEFQMNAGKDGYIFNPKEHPYFKVAPKDVARAKDNFGMPIPPPPPPKVAAPPKPPTQETAPKPSKVAPKVAPKTAAKEFNYDFYKMDELQSQRAVKEMFQKNGGINAMIDMRGLPKRGTQRAELLTQLQNLMNEYKLNPSNGNMNMQQPHPIEMKFKSGARVLGEVKTYSNELGLKYGRHASINFGHDGGMPKDKTFIKNSTVLRESSRVDLNKVSVSTLTHEFAHVLSVDIHATRTQFYSNPKAQEFWGKMDKLEAAYQKETYELNKAKNLSGLNDLYLGKYANTNRNEFFAEAFTEYKLSSNPSKYAKEVGKLVDEYYKK